MAIVKERVESEEINRGKKRISMAIELRGSRKK